MRKLISLIISRHSRDGRLGGALMQLLHDAAGIGLSSYPLQPFQPSSDFQSSYLKETLSFAL